MAEAADFTLLEERIDAVPYRFPLDVKGVLRRLPTAKVVAHARSVRPLAHASLLPLLERFLEIKRTSGSPVEQRFYSESVTTPEALLTRCLTQRPLTFYTEGDWYRLRGGQQGRGGFEKIGTEAEDGDLVLSKLLSYDEMQLSALVGVSVPTFFINDGAMNNVGRQGPAESYEESGLYVGLVGARLEKKDVMEWQHCVITKKQNTTENGYGSEADPASARTQLLRMWAEHYYGVKGASFPTYDDASRLIRQPGGQKKFIWVERQSTFMNVEVYRRRMLMNAEPYLLEANDRAASTGRLAFVVVLGLGLGVWRYIDEQTRIMLEAYHEAISRNSLSHIADINFIFMSESSIGGVQHGGLIADKDGHKIRVLFTRDMPAAKLRGSDEEKLLITMYAWDGNSYPGNEYWIGSLSASGDPAAMCCSTLPVLQNPDINPERIHGSKIVWWGEL